MLFIFVILFWWIILISLLWESVFVLDIGWSLYYLFLLLGLIIMLSLGNVDGWVDGIG